MATLRNPKITMPVMARVAERVRLFRRLDDASRRSAMLWVSAPAGSGKTTLAATWLSARRRACVWYQIDARDADPAAFFYYVREAAALVSRRCRGALPLLTADDDALGRDAYARHFFERLGAGLPPGTWIVLDDYQELPEKAPLQALLPGALGALADGVRVLVLSRAAPPPTYARLLAGEALAVVSGDELCLTDEETSALARARTGKPIAPPCLAGLQAITGGWLAGTVLLLETPELVPGPAATLDGLEHEVLFDYFATELFDRASPQAQRLLLATALLPEIDEPSAEALTGDRHAGHVLRELVRRNYFTTRLGGPQPHYRYHPLFRSFLVAQARRALDPSQARANVERAAELLLAAGRPDDAAAILARERSTERLADVIRAHAPELARQGRLASIEVWLRTLPRGMVEDDPWLSYWQGARRSSAPGEARGHFERAYHLFQARDDVPGMFTAWAAVMGTFFHVWHEYDRIDRWMAELAELRRRAPSYPSDDVEAQVDLAVVAAAMLRGVPPAELAPWLERAAAMIGSVAPAQLRMRLALYLVMYWIGWRGDVVRARDVLERARPLAKNAEATPLTSMYWDAAEAFLLGRSGDPAESLAAVERGLETARRSGIMVLQPMFATSGTFAALAAGDVESARRYRRIAGEAVRREGTWLDAYHHALSAWVDLCAGDLEGADANARAAMAAARRSGSGMAIASADQVTALLHVERGETADGLALLDGCIAWARANDSVPILRSALLASAHAHLVAARPEEALAPLEEGLRVGRERGLPPRQWSCWRRDVMARLAAFALERGVEAEAAVELVRELRLPPPQGAPECWPHPVRIRMLGAFEVWREGQRVTFSRKVQRRPLELLRAIVALGGADVHEEALVDALWPDAEGDAGAHALETAAYRLRKLLGSPGVLAQRERRLTLDRGTCWVDAFALGERLSRALERLDRRALAGRELAREVERVLALYRGALVPAVERGPDCAEAMRARLRAQLARFLRGAAARLAADGDAAASEACAARARELDEALAVRA